jgi:outer membrane autotransporter protein
LPPFNIWIDGTFLAHKRDQNDGKWGSFAMLNLGADYLLSERALVGLSFHFDRMTDPSDADAELTGNGWFAGPYASLEIGQGVFWDTSLLYGGSANDIDTEFWNGDFDTTRWIIDTAITGEWQLDDATVLTPKLRAVYFNEKVDDYSVRNDAGDEIAIDGFDAQQFRVSLGAEIARSFTLDNGSALTPKLGVTAGYSGQDGSGLFGSITAGFSLQTADLWMLSADLLFDIEGDGEKAAGGKVRAGRQF